MICDECMREFPACLFPNGIYKRINFDRDYYGIINKCTSFISSCKLIGKCKRACYRINQCKRCVL